MNLGKVHAVDSDVATWLSKIDGPEKTQLMAARKELAFAEYCASSGLYGQAYASLRLFLELSFAAVHFSVHELERRKWLSDRQDFSWSRALDVESGVLSRDFVIEFAPTLVESAGTYSKDASSAYRQCSQFIHGKHAAHSVLPDQIEYRRDIVDDWCKQAESAGTAVIFLLQVRYGGEVHSHTDSSLSDVLTARFGHISAIRSLLELAND
ncbi:hypothetical protein [Clavibacter michiganensis]|uniref:hypothetical protein n=1 Tax=Clavibacter michiganensis TaxID=28447 RepID=UPI00117C1306|nr:hypothetical protein [Clavibacter michiganensis]